MIKLGDICSDGLLQAKQNIRHKTLHLPLQEKNDKLISTINNTIKPLLSNMIDIRPSKLKLRNVRIQNEIADLFLNYYLHASDMPDPNIIGDTYAQILFNEKNRNTKKHYSLKSCLRESKGILKGAFTHAMFLSVIEHHPHFTTMHQEDRMDASYGVDIAAYHPKTKTSLLIDVKGRHSSNQNNNPAVVWTSDKTYADINDKLRQNNPLIDIDHFFSMIVNPLSGMEYDPINNKKEYQKNQYEHILNNSKHILDYIDTKIQQ